MSASSEDIFEAEERGWTVYQRELCERFLKVNPDEIEVSKVYVRSLIKLGLFAEAEKVCLHMQKVCNPEKRTSIMRIRGELFERNGLFLPAREIFVQAYEQSEEDSYFLIRAAICSREMGSIAKSIAMSRDALDTSGKWRKFAVFELAHGLAILRRYDEALEIVQNHVQNFGADEYFDKQLPDIEQAMAFRSLNESVPKLSSKVRMKQIEEADEPEFVYFTRELCEVYLRDYPKENGRRIWALAIYCQSLIDLSLFDLAEEEISRLEKLAPNLWSAMVRRGYLYDAMGLYPEAVTAYLRAVELPDAGAAPFIFAGSSMFNAGNLEAAIDMARRATECPSSDLKDGCFDLLDEAYFNLGGYQLGLKRYAESKKCYEKVLELEPDDVGARLRLEDLEKVFQIGKHG